MDWFEGTCCRKPWSHGYHRCKDHGFRSVDFPKPILILRYWSWGSTLRNPRLYAMIGSDLRLSCFNVWPPLADWAGAMKAWKRRRGDTRSAIQNGLATHTHNIIYIYTHVKYNAHIFLIITIIIIKIIASVIIVITNTHHYIFVSQSFIIAIILYASVIYIHIFQNRSPLQRIQLLICKRSILSPKLRYVFLYHPLHVGGFQYFLFPLNTCGSLKITKHHL